MRAYLVFKGEERLLETIAWHGKKVAHVSTFVGDCYTTIMHSDKGESEKEYEGTTLYFADLRNVYWKEK
ncbi:hypothetical protein [Oceanobacillus indicireducens]|uniref:Uncharacterized protein n=1 Tax=Oceanobacillus indicireducens TaxID=1004261 RepID=A0A917Y4B0_9BACI|nr:hypothetical protein [Oceanobacillus indicireducens]GGN64556.1 hypothetical protein GCM10007971_32550 [Oceanobacillus indicireducens]